MQDQDGLWNYPTGNPSTAAHSATGYQWLFRRLGHTPGDDNMMPPFLFGRKYLTKITNSLSLTFPGMPIRVITTASEIELAADMVNSSGTAGAANENFFGAKGGWPLGHHTSHMRSAKKPAGGQILFLDGHVDWRDFTSMRVQQQHSGNNYYW